MNIGDCKPAKDDGIEIDGFDLRPNVLIISETESLKFSGIRVI